MNILHLTERFRDGAVGGAQVSVDLLATTQAEKGHQVTVLSMSESPVDRKINGGLRSIKLPLRRAYQSLRQEHPPLWESVGAHICDGYLYGSPSGFSEILDEVKPDVVHSHIIAAFQRHLEECERKEDNCCSYYQRLLHSMCALYVLQTWHPMRYDLR